MCGLVGLVIKGQNGGVSWDADIFQQLLYIDTLRGEDSTGVVLHCNDGDTRIIKDAVAGPEFIKTDKFKTLRNMFISRGKALMGHNRKKTVGEIKAETAHPFVFDDRFVFMHNGTLTNHYSLKQDLGDKVKDLKTDIDSEILGRHIAHLGQHPDELADILGKVSGAYACAWLDHKDEFVYLIRNDERPLYYAETDIGIVYASEPAFIYAVCSRNKTKVTNLIEVDVETLYQIDVSNGKDHCKVASKKLTIKKAPLPSYSAQTGGSSTAEVTWASGTKGGRFSAKSLKKFRQEYLHRTIAWWVDEYTVVDHAHSKFMLYGQCISLDEIPHMLTGTIENVDEDYAKNLIGYIVTGEINSIHYDQKAGMLMINCGSVTHKPYDYSKTKTAVH